MKTCVSRVRGESNVQAAADDGLLELRPYARAAGGAGADRRRGSDLSQSAGRGNLLPNAPASRIRCGGVVAFLLHAFAVPGGLPVHRDPDLSLALFPAFVYLYSFG